MEKGWVVPHFAFCFCLGLGASALLRSLKLCATDVPAQHGLLSVAWMNVQLFLKVYLPPKSSLLL